MKKRVHLVYESLEDYSDEEAKVSSASSDDTDSTLAFTADELEAYRQRVEESLFEVQGQYDKHILTVASASLALSIGYVRTLPDGSDLQLPYILVITWCVWLGCIGAVVTSFFTSQLSHQYILRRLERDEYKYEHSDNVWATFTRYANLVGYGLFIAGGIMFLIVASHNIPLR